MSDKQHIEFDEFVKVTARERFPGNYYILRLQSPALAQSVQPGQMLLIQQFVEEAGVALVIALMRRSAELGWVEISFHEEGPETHWLTEVQTNDYVKITGIEGAPFLLQKSIKRLLLLGQGNGIGNIFFLADQLHSLRPSQPMLVMLGFNGQLPFQPRPSNILINNVPPQYIATMPLFENRQIPTRLAMKIFQPGCFEGSVTAFAETWLDAYDKAIAREVDVIASGPAELCQAVEALGEKYSLSWQTRETM